ncbi:hypothetical protein DVH24_001516 [Malus domestica]|uniref:Uncharacterized protein n=1 Tax=Malus domestica TaxID=3750 RepID=A0A498K7F7_MALDO|nr:hypothetical protein DVH24_001516 [Malus domestica]
MPNHAMACFKIPVGTCKEMERVISQFWWRGQSMKKGFGLGMNSIHMEHYGWTFLKFKEARNVLQIWRNQIMTWRIRNRLKRRNIILTNLILSNIIQTNLILSYPILILSYLISSCKGDSFSY